MTVLLEYLSLETALVLEYLDLYNHYNDNKLLYKILFWLFY